MTEVEATKSGSEEGAPSPTDEGDLFCEHRLRPYLLIGAIFCLTYAVLRLKLNFEFSGAPWDELIALTSPHPFASRVLLPWIASLIIGCTGLSPILAFGVTEFTASCVCCFVIYKFVRRFVPERRAYFFSLLFLFLLPFLFLFRFRWPVFYPYDTPAIAFALAGTYAFLQHRTLLFLTLIIFATLNRETAVIIPLAAFFLSIGGSNFSRRLVLVGAGFAVHLLTRAFLAWLIAGREGPMMYFYLGMTPRIWINFCWLLHVDHWPLFLSNLGFMPVLWCALWNFIPLELRRLRFASLLVLIPMFVVGNIYEPRKDGEAFALLYVPVAIALDRWLFEGKPRTLVRKSGMLSKLDEWGVTAALLVILSIIIACWLQIFDWLPDPVTHVRECIGSPNPPWMVRPGA